jgi:bacillolysin
MEKEAMKHTSSRIVSSTLLLLALLAGIPWPAGAQEPVLQIHESSDPVVTIEQLRQETGGQLQVSYHAQTGQVQYIGTDLEHPISLPLKAREAGSPEDTARQFLARYGPLFGLQDAGRELEVLRVATRDRGRTFVRFQQVHQGVPVFGGELIVQLDEDGNVVSASGEILPGLALEPTPAITAGEAQARALAAVARRYGLRVEELAAGEPELWIYNPILLQPEPDQDLLVWRLEITAGTPLAVRELVLVDARLGLIALQFPRIASARNRIIYDNNNNPAYGLPGNGPVRVEGQGPTGNADVDAAYDYTGHTYDFYLAYHGRDSIDGAGMNIISTVRFCPSSDNCPYANAYWNGQQMVFGQGYASADDVVAHELTHGVTDYESNLFYYTQSGAINEAFSDIWGEFVDLTNGAGNDSPAMRWLVGEDLPIGAIRSMSDPTLYEQPDSMSSYYYYCDLDDGCGVHTNSGVGNKAAFLMVDGGSFGGYSVAALGLDKTARIWYEAQSNLLTSAGDYGSLHDALRQACVNLVGTGGISTADCQAVTNAVKATRMDQPPTGCPATDVPLCDSGRPINVFYDDLENPSSGRWTHGALVGTDQWYYPATDNPYNYNATWATSGQHNFWGLADEVISDTYMRMTADVTLPANALLHFQHANRFEHDYLSNYDGGVLEYSTDAGSTWHDAGPLMVDNGYTGTIYNGAGNPLADRSAFVGNSYGYRSTRLNLSSLAGQPVRFRFRIGTDEATFDYGWFIDDVSIYTCQNIVARAWVYLPIVVRQPSAPPSNWVTLIDERFEGAFPAGWTLLQNGTSGEYYWGKRTCRVYEGSYSGWAVGGGGSGSSLPCGSAYPHSTSSWMYAGPFNLAGATAADLSYKLWLNSEAGYDFFRACASLDGNTFYCASQSEPTGGWVDGLLDLAHVPTLGNVVGQPQVWVAFIFQSDNTISVAEGAYLDNILLRKYVPGME